MSSLDRQGPVPQQKEDPMRTRLLWLLSVPALLLSLTAMKALDEPRKGNPEAEAAIQKNGEAFVEAFHKGDAKAVAAFWTRDGEYIDQTGVSLKGREAIEKKFRD